MQHYLPCTACRLAFQCKATCTFEQVAQAAGLQLRLGCSYVALRTLHADTVCPVLQEGEDSMEAMKAALTFVLKWGSILAFILIPIWPLLALPARVFDEGESCS